MEEHNEEATRKRAESAWIASDTCTLMEPLKFSDWECELFGMGRYGIKIVPVVGNVPNAFWRWMQYLVFGNRWKRREQPMSKTNTRNT